MLERMNDKIGLVDAAIIKLDRVETINSFKIMMLRDLKEVATATSKKYHSVQDYGRIAQVSAFIAAATKEISKINNMEILDPLGYIILDVLDSLED